MYEKLESEYGKFKLSRCYFSVRDFSDKEFSKFLTSTRNTIGYFFDFQSLERYYYRA
jgi:hypothetical protein